MNWKDTPLFVAAPLAVGFGLPPTIQFQAKLIGHVMEGLGDVIGLSWFLAFVIFVLCIAASLAAEKIITIRDILPNGGKNDPQ